MQNLMALFIFSVLDGKNPFGVNLAQTVKTVSLSWNSVLRIIYVEFSGTVDVFCLGLETPFLDNFCPKNQNCQCNLKFGP